MSSNVQTVDRLKLWWGELPNWQKIALGVGAVSVVGAVVYATATYGAAFMITTSSGTKICLGVGKVVMLSMTGGFG